MNTKENKAIRKQALKDYLTQRIHHGGVFIRYLRAEDGKPYACLAALRVAGDGEAPVILVGWSLCSQRDQFDRKKALKIAVSRALSVQVTLSGTDFILAERYRTPAIPLGNLHVMALDAKQYFEERDKKK